MTGKLTIFFILDADALYYKFSSVFGKLSY